MPAAIAIPALATAIGGVAAAGASIYGANKTSSANTHAADLQSQAAEQQLAYTKQQAAIDQANFIATQKANYGQYAARNQYLSSLGQILGAPPRTLGPAPSYQSVNPDGTLGSIVGAR